MRLLWLWPVFLINWLTLGHVVAQTHPKSIHASPPDLPKSTSGSSSGSKAFPSSSKKKIDDDDYDDDDYYDKLDDLDEVEYLKGKLAKAQANAKNSKHRTTSDTTTNDWTHTDCPPLLEGRCHCGKQKDPYDRSQKRFRMVVNCTDAGFTNADFLKAIPNDTEVLIVRGNRMRELPVNVFGVEDNLTLLRELDLSNNGIEEIKGKSFHHVGSVETLILNYNKISQESLRHERLLSNFYSLRNLHLTNAFAHNPWLLEDLLNLFRDSKLTKLIKVHLEQNSINRIPDPRQFCDLKDLMDIYLAQNELTDVYIDLEDSSCLPELRLIDLTGNKVNKVTRTSGIWALINHLNEKSEPVSVDLYKNPFNCDCALQDYITWLQNTSRIDPDRIRHRSGLRCASGLPGTNKDLILFNVKETKCPEPLRTTNEVINTLSWTLFSLIMLSSLIILGALYLHKMGVPQCLVWVCNRQLQSPLLQTTTIKYTSVDKEEVSEVANV